MKRLIMGVVLLGVCAVPAYGQVKPACDARCQYMHDLQQQQARNPCVVKPGVPVKVRP